VTKQSRVKHSLQSHDRSITASVSLNFSRFCAPITVIQRATYLYSHSRTANSIIVNSVHIVSLKRYICQTRRCFSLSSTSYLWAMGKANCYMAPKQFRFRETSICYWCED